ncbi:MAG TPA: ribosomal L7Ae/L30e/S12e/Gadd45 family protein [Gemmatimonadaceae bacterium]|nr:ribosomal L7Ae/L30e/S12e/Gadd45 family protein [Gemmatimonadaceae bacterium]
MPVRDERKLLGLLGLGARGRLVVIGVDQVREAVRRGKVVLALLAPDASEHGRKKVVPLLMAKRIPIVEGPSATALGAAVGRETTTVVGVVDRELAKGILGLADL